MTPVLNKGVLLYPLCLLMLAGCASDTDMSAGFGSETTNGVTATVKRIDGTPAAGALVRLRPIDYVRPLALDKARLAVREATTDSNGCFVLDSIEAGEYRIEVTDRDSSAVLIDTEINAFVDAGEHVLRRYATIIGTVEPAPHGTAQYVQVYGMERLAGVHTDGTYCLGDLPAGSYRLRIITADTAPAQIIDSISALPGDTTVVHRYAPWLHSKKIVLNTTSSGAGVTETVHAFPLLVRLSASNFDFGQADSLGADIRFSTPDGVPLPYEMELWDVRAAKAAIWVRVDTVRGNNDTQCLTMLWGNSAVSDRSAASSVFDTGAGFAGVWHLTSGIDATANGNNTTPHGTIAQQGPIGGARWFDGIDDFLDCGADGSLAIAGDLTISAWVTLADVQADRYMRIVTNKPDIAQVAGYELECNPSHMGESYLTLFTAGPTEYARSYAGEWAHDQWHYCVATLRDTTATLYRNGQRHRVQPDSIVAAPIAGTDALRIGGWNGDYFHGGIEEVRISRVARSEAWVRLCYENQKPSQTLVTLE